MATLGFIGLAIGVAFVGLLIYATVGMIRASKKEAKP